MTKNRVVTAAHCIWGLNFELDVLVGVLDTSHPRPGARKKVVGSVIHPRYVYDDKDLLKNLHDIAILAIEPVNMVRFINVCLPTNDKDKYAG